MVKDEGHPETRPEEASSPVFTALASAFGMAIAELALAVGEPGDVDLALREAEVAAKATLLSADRRCIRWLPRSTDCCGEANQQQR